MTKQSEKPTTDTDNVSQLKQPQPVSLVAKIATKYGVDPNKFWETLKSTAFKQRDGSAPTNEQMMALLVVASEYGLNPFTREIYAFPDKNNGIVPVVGIDGWSRIINSHPQFDGMDFKFAESTVELNGLTKPVIEWIECIMYRKDRTRPTVIREYLEEIYREPFKGTGNKGPYIVNGPWQTHPRRFARHKVIIQTARIALGYVGIYDEDEAKRIIEGTAKEVSSQPSITFDASDTAYTVGIDAPKRTPDIMSDLAQADFNGGDLEGVLVESETVQVAQSNQSSEPIESNFFETRFGPIAHKDAKMINQMVNFTVENGSWDTTKDSFKERYSDGVLDFALSELNAAFNKAFEDA